MVLGGGGVVGEHVHEIQHHASEQVPPHSFPIQELFDKY